MGSGTNLTDTSFLSEEGLQQGAIESSGLFCLVINAANKKTNAWLSREGGALSGGYDDTYMAGPPEQLLDAHQDSLKSVGLTLNRSKSKIFTPDGMRTTNLLHRCQQHNIEEGSIKLNNTTSPYLSLWRPTRPAHHRCQSPR